MEAPCVKSLIDVRLQLHSGQAIPLPLTAKFNITLERGNEEPRTVIPVAYRAQSDNAV